MAPLTLGNHYLKSALFLAHVSCAAYENDSETYENFQHFEFDDKPIPFACDPLKDGEATRGFLAAQQDAIVLAFKGSENILDWATNLDCIQIEDNGAQVHRGFMQALEKAWPTISESLQKMLERKKRKIWVTGHSLGGALATLATRRLLLDMKVDQIETHTFGQPRVGDKAMCRQMTSTFYRFAYTSDPITFFPLWTMSYSHAGTLKNIDATGKIHEDASNCFSRVQAGLNALKQVKFSDWEAFFRERKEDHSLQNYIEKIAHATK